MVPRGVLVHPRRIGVLGIHMLLERKWKQKLPKRGKSEKKQKNFRFVTMNFEVVIIFCDFFALLELPIKGNPKGKSGLYYIVT